MKIKVFISYSHSDSKYLADDSLLLSFLKGLEREGVEFWWDQSLIAGDKWDEEIKAQIREAHIALLLVSQQYLDSHYCRETEISGFIQRCHENGLVVFPIRLSPCEWERDEWLKARQFLPDGGENIEEHFAEERRQKKLFLEIRQHLRGQIDRLRSQQPEVNPAPKEILETTESGESDDKSLSSDMNLNKKDSDGFNHGEHGGHGGHGENQTNQSPPRDPRDPRGSNLPKHESQGRDLLGLLDGFSQALQQEKWSSVIGGDFVTRLKNKIGEIDRFLATEFSIVVIGDFSRGKSTLINALLGNNVVTSDVLPETITINQIRYGESYKVEAHLSDGSVFPLSPEEIKSERLKKVLERLPARPTHLQIEYPSQLLQGIQLVDTPGLGDIVDNYDDTVQAYLKQADAVIYVVSAISPLSASEREFLQASLRSYEFSKLCFIVNSLDRLASEEENHKIVEFAKNRLQRIFPNARVFGLSALEEFRRLKGQPSNNPDRAIGLGNAFGKFREFLRESYVTDRQLTQLDRASLRAGSLIDECEADLRRLQQALSVNQTQIEVAITECEDRHSGLRKRIDQHEDKVRSEIVLYGEETVAWMNGFIDRFQTEVISNLSKYRHEDLQRHFSFFFSDRIRSALFQCFDHHQTLIMEKLEIDRVTLAGINNLASDNPDQSDIAEEVTQAGFDPGGWTFIDNIHLFFHGVSGLLGSVLLGLADKKIGEKYKVSRYQSHLSSSIPSLKIALAEEIRKQYLEIASLVAQIRESKYRNHLEIALVSLKQARKLQSNKSKRPASLDNILQGIDTQIKSTGDALRGFQSELQAKQQKTIIDLLGQ